MKQKRDVRCMTELALLIAIILVVAYTLFSDTWLGYTGNEGSGFSLLLLMLSGVALNGLVEAAACLHIDTAVSKARLHTLH